MTAPQDPPPAPSGIKAEGQFFPMPANFDFTEVTLGGQDMIALFMVTGSTQMCTFWSKDALLGKLRDVQERLSGIEVAPAGVMRLLRPDGQ